MPLFPELRPYQDEAFERAAPSAVHVITRWRDSEKNLRTGLLRILRHAGVKPWPRFYQNLRSSRETELVETFPIHVVAESLGNSPKTALAYYMQVTEEHYQRALQNPVQQPAALPCIEPQEQTAETLNSEAVRELAIRSDSLRRNLMTPTGFEPVSRP